MVDKIRNLRLSKKIPTLWLCYILIPINFLGDYFFKTIGIPPIVLNGFTCIVFFIITLFFTHKIIVYKPVFLFLLINCLVIFEHMIFVGDFAEELKHIFYILIFVLVSCSSLITQNTYFHLKKIVLLLTIFMSFDAFRKSGIVINLDYRMFNIRNYTVFDKTCYTQLFPFAIIILFNKILKESNIKRKVIYSFWILGLTYIMFFYFQSKTGIIATCLAIFGELFFINRKYRSKLIKITGLSILGIFVYTIVVTQKMPDYLIALLSFLGLSTSSVNSVYYETYYFRLEIIGNVIEIIKTHPFLGIGFGNYYNYVTKHNMQRLTVGIEDVESSFLALFAEGGVVYFMTTLMIWIILYKQIKHNSRYAPEIIGTFICMIILLFGNDYMNLFYWVWLGIYWRISTNESTSQNLQKNKMSINNYQI